MPEDTPKSPAIPPGMREVVEGPIGSARITDPATRDSKKPEREPFPAIDPDAAESDED